MLVKSFENGKRQYCTTVSHILYIFQENHLSSFKGSDRFHTQRSPVVTKQVALSPVSTHRLTNSAKSSHFLYLHPKGRYLLSSQMEETYEEVRQAEVWLKIKVQETWLRESVESYVRSFRWVG